MEKDRLVYMEEKKSKHLKKLKIIETLKSERNSLKDRLNVILEGPHAKQTKEVGRQSIFFLNYCFFLL